MKKVIAQLRERKAALSSLRPSVSFLRIFVTSSHTYEESLLSAIVYVRIPHEGLNFSDDFPPKRDADFSFHLLVIHL